MNLGDAASVPWEEVCRLACGHRHHARSPASGSLATPRPRPYRRVGHAPPGGAGRELGTAEAASTSSANPSAGVVTMDYELPPGMPFPEVTAVDVIPPYGCS